MSLLDNPHKFHTNPYTFDFVMILFLHLTDFDTKFTTLTSGACFISLKLSSNYFPPSGITSATVTSSIERKNWKTKTTIPLFLWVRVCTQSVRRTGSVRGKDTIASKISTFLHYSWSKDDTGSLCKGLILIDATRKYQ